MTRESKPTNPGYSAANLNMRIGVIGAEVGCVTLLIVLASVLGGLWLDKMLGTKPIITFVLVLVSAPLSLFLTFKIAMRSMKNITNHTELPPSSKGKQISVKEEEE